MMLALSTFTFPIASAVSRLLSEEIFVMLTQVLRKTGGMVGSQLYPRYVTRLARVYLYVYFCVSSLPRSLILNRESRC